MNPFEIFSLMAAAALVIQVLLAALLQLEARLMATERERFEARSGMRAD